MRTIQGSIHIQDYKTRLEQAITNPARTPSYVIAVHGKYEKNAINHALLYFETKGASNYGKGDVSVGHRIRVFLNHKDYSMCLDLLRNEKPVFFHYSYLLYDNNTSNKKPELQYYALSTKKEPVGEGE